MQILIDSLPPPKRTHLPIMLITSRYIYHINRDIAYLYLKIKEPGNILQVGPYVKHRIPIMTETEIEKTVSLAYECDSTIRSAIIEFSLPRSSSSALQSFKTNKLYDWHLVNLIFAFLKNKIPQANQCLNDESDQALANDLD
jgi:hypothetical protein